MNNLIIKYAMLGVIFTPVGIFLADLIGMQITIGYVSAAISGAIGGGIAGYIRQKQGKND